jgi:hypothetical protein
MVMKRLSYDPRSRYRHRNVYRFTIISSVLLIAVVGGSIGYGLGYQSAFVESARLESDLKTVTSERDRLRTLVNQLMADNHNVNMKYQQIEEQLQSELPQEGALKNIVSQIRDQLNAGVDPKRLGEIIHTLAPPKNCIDPETRRFIVQVDPQKESASPLLLADSGIKIEAVGMPARNASGSAEAWYDPSSQISVKIEYDGEGQKEKIERKNVLPFSQVLISKGREYRLTFAEGAKSFLKVTFDSCDYP